MPIFMHMVSQDCTADLLIWLSIMMPGQPTNPMNIIGMVPLSFLLSFGKLKFFLYHLQV